MEALKETEVTESDEFDELLGLLSGSADVTTLNAVMKCAKVSFHVLSENDLSV